MSSKSVARSAGLRSIRRGRQVAVRCRTFRPDPADRSPGPFRSRPLVSSVSVQFVSFRPFVCCLFQFACRSFLLVPFCSFPLACSRFPVLFACLSGSFLVQSRSGSPCSRSVSFVSRSVSFGSVFVLLSLFCARAFSRAGLFILFSRILYTKRGQRQMNFLSKNMSFLIISVSTLNYPNLELISPLHFASNRLLTTHPRKPPSFPRYTAEINPSPFRAFAPRNATGSISTPRYTAGIDPQSFSCIRQ